MSSSPKLRRLSSTRPLYLSRLRAEFASAPCSLFSHSPTPKHVPALPKRSICFRMRPVLLREEMGGCYALVKTRGGPYCLRMPTTLMLCARKSMLLQATSHICSPSILLASMRRPCESIEHVNGNLTRAFFFDMPVYPLSYSQGHAVRHR